MKVVIKTDGKCKLEKIVPLVGYRICSYSFYKDIICISIEGKLMRHELSSQKVNVYIPFANCLFEKDGRKFIFPIHECFDGEIECRIYGEVVE